MRDAWPSASLGIERGLSFAVGIAAMLVMRPSIAPAPAPAPPPVVVTTRVPMPVPLVIEDPEPMLVPDVIVPVPPAPLDCPTPPRADDVAIGTPTGMDLDTIYDPDPRTQIAASVRAPVLALRTPAGAVLVSDDDGRRFAGAFADHVASSIAVDDRGRVYALTSDGIGVRDERGRERWSPITCEAEQCSDAIVAAGDSIVWIHDEKVRRSRDGGRTWHAVDDADGGDLVTKSNLFAMNGAIYGTQHVSEECGWDADQLARIDLATGASTTASFDNDPGSPRLDVVEDAGATWRYRAHGANVRDLVLARLQPAVGARVLFASGRQLAELCGDRARVIAHGYDADRVDAVDAAGRPLIAIGERVFRFSTRYGWRELAVPAPVARGGD